MRLLILLSFISLCLTACGKGGGGSSDSVNANSAASANSLDGEYFTAAQNTGNNNFAMTVVDIKDNHFQSATMVFPNSNPSLIYYRKSEGTYVKSGDSIVITYSYETCNPVGSETIKISAADPSDRIFMTSGATTIQFLNVDKYIPNTDYRSTSLVMQEDVNCNLF